MVFVPSSQKPLQMYKKRGILDSLNPGFSKHAFREVPSGFRRGTMPGATLVRCLLPQECQKKSPEKRTFYGPRRHVCIARFLLRSASQGVQRDRARDSPFLPENILKSCFVPGWKARLGARHVWKMQINFGITQAKEHLGILHVFVRVTCCNSCGMHVHYEAKAKENLGGFV